MFITLTSSYNNSMAGSTHQDQRQFQRPPTSPRLKETTTHLVPRLSCQAADAYHLLHKHPRDKTRTARVPRAPPCRCRAMDDSKGWRRARSFPLLAWLRALHAAVTEGGDASRMRTVFSQGWVQHSQFPQLLPLVEILWLVLHQREAQFEFWTQGLFGNWQALVVLLRDF